jgi:hypothetical protein
MNETRGLAIGFGEGGKQVFETLRDARTALHGEATWLVESNEVRVLVQNEAAGKGDVTFAQLPRL